MVLTWAFSGGPKAAGVAAAPPGLQKRRIVATAKIVDFQINGFCENCDFRAHPCGWRVRGRGLCLVCFFTEIVGAPKNVEPRFL